MLALIDEYLAGVPDEARAAVQALREQVRGAAPGAVEAVSCGVPGFKYRGRPLVTYAAFKGHCGLYPMSPAVIEAYAAELVDYEAEKGTVRFQAARPLPASGVRKLVVARVAEIDALAK